MCAYAFAGFLAGGAQVARAGAITYSYQGNDFSSVHAPYTTSNFVSGSFTVGSPLGDSLTAVDVSSLVTALSFTDGSVNTINSSNVDGGYRFVVSTDSSGNITAWDVTLIHGVAPTNSALFTCSGITTYFNSCPSNPYDWSYENNGGINGLNASNPGNWTATLDNLSGGSTSAPVILPAGLVLAGITGTIGGFGSEDYYTFSWAGGTFSATASITGANGGASYIFSEGVAAGSCSSGGSQTLNSGDNFTGTIGIASLAPGQYCIGVEANSASDPAFTLTFNTPVDGTTPEPATIIPVALGSLAVLAASRRRRELIR